VTSARNKISLAAAAALKAGTFFQQDNTSIGVAGQANDHTEWTYMDLFGNRIAEHLPHDRELWLTLAGHPTRTTRERLNAILEVFSLPYQLHQSAGTQYLRHTTTQHEAALDTDAWYIVHLDTHTITRVGDTLAPNGAVRMDTITIYRPEEVTA